MGNGIFTSPLPRFSSYSSANNAEIPPARGWFNISQCVGGSWNLSGPHQRSEGRRPGQSGSAAVHLTRGLPRPPPPLPSACSFCVAAARSLFFLLTPLSGSCSPSGAGLRQGQEQDSTLDRPPVRPGGTGASKLPHVWIECLNQIQLTTTTEMLRIILLNKRLETHYSSCRKSWTLQSPFSLQSAPPPPPPHDLNLILCNQFSVFAHHSTLETRARPVHTITGCKCK